MMATTTTLSPVSRWWIFARERFEPASHLILILLFFGGHWAVLHSLEETTPAAFTGTMLFLGTVAFFFKLRLYDEIKDYEVDLEFNPTRPLVRGVVTHKHLYGGIAVCILIELVTFGSQGIGPLLSIAFAVGYSLLMYKEFFIGKWLRPHLTTYAVTHTVVSSFLTLALLSAMTERGFWELPLPYIFFGLNSWCLFNVFEFGRKTFATGEERNRVSSYSKVFGRFGAVALVIAMAVASTFLTAAMGLTANSFMNVFPGLLVLGLTLAGGAYATSDRPSYGKVYRTFSSAYILLAYLGLVFSYGVL